MHGQVGAASTTHAMQNVGAAGPTPGAQRLSGGARKFLLTVHVVLAAGVLGADGVVLALGIAGLSGTDPVTVYPALHIVAVSVVVPLAVLTLIGGIALALATGWGLFRQWWVTAKLAITAVLTVLAAVLLVPGSNTAADAARAVAGATLTSAERTRLFIIPMVATTALVVNVFLAVYKPHRGRTSA